MKITVKKLHTDDVFLQMEKWIKEYDMTSIPNQVRKTISKLYEQTYPE